MTASVPASNVRIVGVGACTAVGHDARASAAAVRAAISGFADHRYLTDKEGAPVVLARPPFLPESRNPLSHFAALAEPAANEALRPLFDARSQITGIPLLLGLPPVRPGRPASLDPELSDHLKLRIGGGTLFSVVRVVPLGHAAGFAALEQAWRLIRAGSLEACLVGGVDSYDADDTLEWLDELEQLHSKPNRWGFTPGVGAGFVLLAAEQFVKKHKLPDLGEVLEVAVSQEQNLIKTESVCLGEGLTSAIRQVLEPFGSEEKPIHQVICDLNGERYRATEFGYTLTRTGERFADPGEYLAPADCWGDVGAASAPLFICLAVAAASKDYAAGPNTLIWASSESGERGAAVIRIPSVEQ